jgi:hypothetical protein
LRAFARLNRSGRARRIANAARPRRGDRGWRRGIFSGIRIFLAAQVRYDPRRGVRCRTCRDRQRQYTHSGQQLKRLHVVSFLSLPRRALCSRSSGREESPYCSRVLGRESAYATNAACTTNAIDGPVSARVVGRGLAWERYGWSLPTAPRGSVRYPRLGAQRYWKSARYWTRP